MLQFVVYGLVLGALFRDCASQCPSSRWSSYDGYCYSIIYGYPESAKSWYDADDYCRQENGTLASIHSVEEVNFLIEQLKSWQITDYVWIGLHSLSTPGRFNWSDGTSTDFEIWESPRASNKCVMMRKKTGEWKDQNCGYLQGFVCKRKQGAIVSTPPPVGIYVPSGNCTPDWYQYGSKCYKFFDDKVSWKDAKKSCESLGVNHHLASIHNTNEQMFLTSVLGYQKNDAWIGLERSYTSRLEMWSDNSRYDYSNWMKGDGGYYWITMCPKIRVEAKTAGKWEGSMCNVDAGYICQKNPDPAIKNRPTIPSTCSVVDYINYRDSCYRFVRERKTWQQAQQHCQKDGGNLVTVTDEFEHAFLYHTAEDVSENVWIGLSDKEGDGDYQWEDKWPKLYLRWQRGEPTTTNVPKCAYANNFTREWRTADCGDRYSYVCKINKEPPPVLPIKKHQGKCPFPSNSTLDFGGEHCYHLGDTSFKQWSSALLYCMKKGTTLASFHSIYETELLWPLIGIDSALMWIGMYQREDGMFIWQNGDKIDFVNWAPGIRQEGGCVYINSKDMFWVRQDCSEGFQFALPLCMAKKT